MNSTTELNHLEASLLAYFFFNYLVNFWLHSLLL